MKHLGLAHIAVLTKDMENTIAFYEKLGGKCTEHGEVPGKLLAMIDMGGFWMEAIQPTECGEWTEGLFPHIAIEVEDVPACGAALKAAGIDTFMTEEPTVLNDLFGGLCNWFFTGPSGEQIELIQHF